MEIPDVNPTLYRRLLAGALLIPPLLLAGCQSSTTPPGGAFADAHALQELSQEPLDSTPWQFGNRTGHEIVTPHYRVYTTIQDPIYQHLLIKVLEAAHTREDKIDPGANVNGPLTCFVFKNRDEWEAYTRMRGGANANIYLHISAGGYCQEGVFAGYDLGREQTLSIIAHESWHQFSWFAFKDRLPSWLEEGLATQNEGIDWDGVTPRFASENNFHRWLALQQAIRENRLWKISDLVRTHAGQAIKRQQKDVDSYYAQLWSFVLFMKSSPVYLPRMQAMLNDARDGKLTAALAGSGVTQAEIDNFTERWNSAAGPIYLRKYITNDPDKMQEEYEAWARKFTSSWPPKHVATSLD